MDKEERYVEIKSLLDRARDIVFGITKLTTNSDLFGKFLVDLQFQACELEADIAKMSNRMTVEFFNNSLKDSEEEDSNSEKAS